MGALVLYTHCAGFYGKPVDSCYSKAGTHVIA